MPSCVRSARSAPPNPRPAPRSRPGSIPARRSTRGCRRHSQPCRARRSTRIPRISSSSPTRCCAARRRARRRSSTGAPGQWRRWCGRCRSRSAVSTRRSASWKKRALAAQEEKLRDETAKLATALRAPAQRGRWGETQLRRTLELAGLRAHVDFLEQPVAQLADGVLRPDVAVRLPGEKTVLLDAKVPLEAYLKSVEAPEADREALLVAHAAQLRAHVDCLSRKQYWEAFAGSPEMAVLFLPSEGLLAAALEVDPALHEDAFAKRIVLATPATLLALLLTIAHVWKQDSIAANAREIANEGRELHKRIADLSRHMAKLGRALESALKTYNGAVGSFDSRLLPAARRFEELKASAVDVQLDPLAEVEVLPRLPRPAGDGWLPDDAN
ncbi:MAG: DNA recombination protein RmuC [Deltaproteobacteria bacterium]|nr:MAG: DNA recombination protein RmuC [Deltaproteobacteria bacterium]